MVSYTLPEYQAKAEYASQILETIELLEKDPCIPSKLEALKSLVETDLATFQHMANFITELQASQFK